MEKSFFTANISKVRNWSISNSLWTFGLNLSCCGVEFLSSNSSRYDLERFGSLLQSEPSNSDVLIVAGPITKAISEKILDIYNSMLTPKYVIAMGSCANTGGIFAQHGKSVILGVDKILPVDIYVPGCPPRPEALIHGMMTLQRKILSSAKQEMERII